MEKNLNLSGRLLRPVKLTHAFRPYLSKTLVFLMIAVFGGSCDDADIPDGESEPVYMEYYITKYMDTSGVNIYRPHEAVLAVDFSGECYSENSVVPQNRARFVEIAARNGDVCRRKIGTLVEMRMRHTVIYADNFTSIDIRSNVAWDAAHPAGSSLGDVFTFSATSYACCIRSDYTTTEGARIKKSVRELTPDDLAMIEAGTIRLSCENSLRHAEAYTLTVTLITTDGRTITGEWTITAPVTPAATNHQR